MVITLHFGRYKVDTTLNLLQFPNTFLIIGFFAIWLSIKFYKWSNDAADKTNEAAKNIASNVQRLETLFDRLYSDTFGMMKDTVDDMRKHIWTKNYTEEDVAYKTEEKANSKIEIVKKELSDELSNLIKRVGETEEKIDSYKDMSLLLDKAINQTRKIETEAKRDTPDANTLNTILRFIDKNDGMTIGELYASPVAKQFTQTLIIKSLERFIKDEIIEPIVDFEDLNEEIQRKKRKK